MVVQFSVYSDLLADGTLPTCVMLARFLGPVAGAISANTALHGDFNGDGIDDLAFSSPHDKPFDRPNAGTLHVLLSQNSVWPVTSDLVLENFLSSTQINIINVYGAKGSVSGDTGDTLAYSGAAADLNGDGIDDIIINEMVVNGISPTTVDVGNLLLLNGKVITEIAANPLCFVIPTAKEPVAVISL